MTLNKLLYWKIHHQFLVLTTNFCMKRLDLFRSSSANLLSKMKQFAEFLYKQIRTDWDSNTQQRFLNYQYALSIYPMWYWESFSQLLYWSTFSHHMSLFFIAIISKSNLDWTVCDEPDSATLKTTFMILRCTRSDAQLFYFRQWSTITTKMALARHNDQLCNFIISAVAVETPW